MTILEGLNKTFESKIRLGIMSVLVANESADFATLKSLLGLTDGNLASHTRSLEEAGYIPLYQKVEAYLINPEYKVPLTKNGGWLYMYTAPVAD